MSQKERRQGERRKGDRRQRNVPANELQHGERRKTVTRRGERRASPQAKPRS